ncbi:MAG: DPP IV N-terminal domain-containing protein, partial [Saprospiraceae bacterium]
MNAFKITKALCIFGLFNTIICAQKHDISLVDIFEKGAFRTKGIGDFDFRNDNKSFTRLVGNQIIRYDLSTGKELDIIFDAQQEGKDLVDKLEEYEFSSNEKYLILKINMERIYRYSNVTETYVYELPSKRLTRIFPKGKIMYPQINLQENKIGFIFENNIYYQDLNNWKIKQVTKDGAKGKIINGASDWVYEEEFTLLRSFEWSPSGDQLTYLKFDESNVKEF